MSIAQFIRDQVLRPRLAAAGCLVVYDDQGRYRELCLECGDDDTHVVDASASSIESRALAVAALRAMAQPNGRPRNLLIYVPARPPHTDEQKQVDPFAPFAVCGAVFPKDDGDAYLDLCLKAKPDHHTEIRRVFAASDGAPAFAVIDAIGGGVSWPQLRTALKAESAREILVSLLAPTEAQLAALKVQDGWVQEARDFLRASLGLVLKTRGKSWSAIADELWRYLLFSEFLFDLPQALPESLQGVPHAPPEARPVVEDVCDQLRGIPRTRASYIERAETIEAELDLAQACRAIEDLGVRDTFPFEERTFLLAAIGGITRNETDVTRRVLARHHGSVWLGKGESQAQWELLRAGLALIEACDDFERQLPESSRSLVDLVDFYVGSLREADRLQREFEQAVAGFLDPHGLMHAVIEQARARYRRLAEKMQGIFVKQVEVGGWPLSGRLANADVFDRLVADRLKDRGRKVAYLMVDALRYELGVALQKLLADDDGAVELHAACAQLPTITPVGMASLLPGALAGLTLAFAGESLLPMLGESPVGNVQQRMGVLARRYGDRFAEMSLGEFVRGKARLAPTVDLLVLRSTEIDSQLENNPETTLELIPGTLKSIRVALHKLRGMGFREAVIATDHGFFLNAQAEAGDVCVKPPGNWPVNAHDRLLLGDGTADAHNLVAAAGRLGIRGAFAQAALPRSMAPYRAGHLYFHGGASLAEAVVPVLVVRLDPTRPEAGKVAVELSYKNGATRITTRVPVVEVSLVCEDMFAQTTSVEILLEAQDGKGNVVGEPRPGGEVNPATRTLTLMPGQRKQIALRMDDEFRGKFALKALNPATLATYRSLALETDYTE